MKTQKRLDDSMPGVFKNVSEAIIGQPESKSLDGVNKLRDIVNWLNSRNEYLNENKSHLQLIKEFNNQH